MAKSANNLEVKKINRNRVFRLINSKENISKPDIASELSLSIPTVMQIVKELLEDELLFDMGEYASTGGRKAMAFASAKRNYFSLGVDITQNHLGFVLTDLSGEVIKHKRIHYPYRNEDDYYKELAQLVNRFIEDNKKEKSICLGVGISIPGIVDLVNKKIVYSHALRIVNTDFMLFTRHIPYECIFINDANAAAIAEIYHGFDQGDIVYLSLSNSVGGAIVKMMNNDFGNRSIRELLYMGNNGKAGEFGHMTLVPKGSGCYCGKTGCADSYISALLLAKNTDNRLESFFEKIEEKDTEICNIWDTYLDYLAIVVNNIRMIFDCNVVIGGYVGSFIEPYLDNLIKKTEIRNTFEIDGSYMRACKYKIEASALGAALLIVDEFIDSI